MRTLRFMFKSICSSSLNWRAGGMYLNAPSREAYRSWKTSWLYTTASHSGQTPFPSHWTQRINQDIWWHGSTQWWHWGKMQTAVTCVENWSVRSLGQWIIESKVCLLSMLGRKKKRFKIAIMFLGCRRSSREEWMDLWKQMYVVK